MDLEYFTHDIRQTVFTIHETFTLTDEEIALLVKIHALTRDLEKLHNEKEVKGHDETK